MIGDAARTSIVADQSIDHGTSTLRPQAPSLKPQASGPKPILRN